MAWQTEAKKLSKRFGCTYKQAKEIRSNLNAGVPEHEAVEAVLGKGSLSNVVGSPLPQLGSSNPVALIQAAGNLVVAAGGNVDRAKEALEAYLKLSAEPKVEKTAGEVSTSK